MQHTFRRDTATATVPTDCGLVRGYAHDGLLIFKGIPYARARRFRAPEPVEPWKDVLDAGSYGFVCPLLQNERPNGELRVPHRYWPMDEDCMNLNVWTPAADEKMRPVLVWLHGGGFEAGSSIEQVAYDGANLSRLGDVVVVSVNHRLNLLGYFDLSDFGAAYANAANAGGDDIIAALGWIHRNIATFGGDPNNVTVFGQSGGGAKVTTLLQSPAADGLYAKGVVMSGVIGPLLPEAQDSGLALAEALMTELKLDDVRGLETVDYRLLAKAYLRVKPRLQQAGHYVGCQPHPNASYRGDPAVFGFRQETAHIPLLVGSVFGEFSSFTPTPYDRAAMSTAQQEAVLRDVLGADGAAQLLPLFRAAYPQRQPIDLLRLDYTFRAPEIAYIAQRSSLNHCTWSYLFNMDQPIDGGCTPWHCCDIPYVFHNIDLVEYPHGPQADPALSKRIEAQCFESLITFARTGNPANGQIPAWPACQPGAEHTLVLDAETRVLTNYDHNLIDLHARVMGPVMERMMEQLRETAQH